MQESSLEKIVQSNGRLSQEMKDVQAKIVEELKKEYAEKFTNFEK